MGKVLAQAGMNEGKHVTWIPAYGPEMRGGTANCSVIISERKIGSPTVGKADIAVVMNIASYQKFLGSIIPGGTLYVNSSIIPDLPGREDIRIVRAPVNELAHQLGNANVANIVMLGVMQSLTPSVPATAVEETLRELGGKKADLAALNLRAFAAGREYAANL